MNTRSRLCSSSNEMSISRLTKPRAQTAVGIGGAGSLRIDSGFPHEQGIPAIIADRSVYGSSAWAPGAAYVPYGWRLQCLPDGLEGQEVAPDISELPCLLGAFNKAKKPAGLPIVRIMVTGMV
jgi:hypothetical protein